MIAAFLIRYWKPLVGLVAILLVWAALAYWGHTKYTAGVADQKAKDKAVFDRLADLTSLTKAAVTTREAEIKGLLASSNKAREEGIAHAVEEQQRIVAGVRDGSLRLRKQWAGCQAANSVPDDGSAKSRADEGAELRAKDAGDLVRVSDDSDVTVRGLQDYARACQANSAPLPVK